MGTCYTCLKGWTTNFFFLLANIATSLLNSHLHLTANQTPMTNVKEPNICAVHANYYVYYVNFP